VELRRLQHRPGSRRGQRSHPLVWSRFPHRFKWFYLLFTLFSCLLTCYSTYLTLKPTSHLQGPIQEGWPHPCKLLCLLSSMFHTELVMHHGMA
jgi:hypothetical protein